ncbi:MAG: protein kinase domain-containing protein [Planctomycetales bacterium]
MTNTPLLESRRERAPLLPTISELIAEATDSSDESVFDARDVLDLHPELLERRSLVIDLAYEDFCRRVDLGERLVPEEFVSRYPGIARSLMRLIDVHHLLADGPQALPQSEPQWPMQGTRWLDFQLLEELGRGAYSRVYLARQTSLGDRLVVVKATSLGCREAETLGRLQHRYIVPVHSVQPDVELALTAVCMPFLSRVSLFDLMDEMYSGKGRPDRATAMLDAVRRLNAITSEVAPRPAGTEWPAHWRFADGMLQIGIQLAEALAHAHRQNVLHCDVKPSNVIITNDGRTMLLDFNLALHGNEDSLFVGGTLPYMAPEQIRTLIAPEGQRAAKLDARTDVFSLGVTLFELCYGRPPFGQLPTDRSRDKTAAHLLNKQKQGPIRCTAGEEPIDPRIGDIIARCLEFDPDRRPQSMDELLPLLRAQLNPKSQTRRWLRRHRQRAVWVGALSCGLAIAAGGWLAVREPAAVRQLRLGETALDRGDNAAAMRHFDAALAGDASLSEARRLSAEARLRLGTAAFREEGFQEAVRHLTSALDLDEGTDEARFFRGLSRFRLGDHSAALADLKLLAEKQGDPAAKGVYAHCFLVAHENSEAARLLFEEAIDAGCNLPAIYNNFAVCLLNEGRFNDADTALQRAVSLDHNLVVAYHNLLRVEFKRVCSEKQCTPRLELVEQLLERCAGCREANLDAARIIAAYCRKAGRDVARSPLIDALVAYADRAAVQGLSAAQFDGLERICPELANDRRWAALSQRTTVERSPKSVDGLVDPIPALVRLRSGATTSVVSRD